MEKRDESGARMCEEQHLVSSISLLRNENGSVADVAIGLFISKGIVWNVSVMKWPVVEWAKILWHFDFSPAFCELLIIDILWSHHVENSSQRNDSAKSPKRRKFHVKIRYFLESTLKPSWSSS